MKISTLTVISLLYFGCTPDRGPIEFTISAPQTDQVLYNNESISLSISTNEVITRVEYYFNGSLIGSSIMAPFSITWTPKDIPPGKHVFTIIVYDENRSNTSDVEVESLLRLGDKYCGGIIFSLSYNGKKGLIATEEDLEHNNTFTFQWGPSDKYLTATSDYDGKTNTDLMSSSSIEGQAGYPFKSININGYDDWYIPSKNELTTLKENKDIVGGFSNDSNISRYWSSTELSESHAFALNFSALMGTSVSKHYSYRIRPIRDF